MTRKALAMLAAALMLSVLSQNLRAVEPDEILDDPVLEARARAISADLRCLVCQNQSIDDSNADLARDLRVIVRERLLAGDSDDQTIDYIVARYGDFVLLSPPVRPSTYGLWFGPPLILAAGLFGLIWWRRRVGGTQAASALTKTERERLASLLGGEREP